MKKKKFLILPLLLLLSSGVINNNHKQINENEINADPSYTIEQISIGYTHSLAVINDGEKDNLYAWGNNSFGQLGTDDTLERTTPTLITTLPEDSNILMIRAGWDESAAVIEANGKQELYLWGNNDFGQLGLGDTTNRDIPTLLVSFDEGQETIEDLDLNNNHSLLVVDTGLEEKAYSAGRNDNGQLGLGNNVNYDEFQEITLLPGGEIKEIETSAWGSGFLITNDFLGDKLYMCGSNGFGELGLGDNTVRFQPTEVTGLLETDEIITQFQMGGSHTFIAKTDGQTEEVYGTGNNDNGQLGTGNNTNTNTYTEITNPLVDSEIVSIQAGSSHTILQVRKDGIDHIYGTGLNNLGQLGLGDTTNRNTFEEITINLPENSEVKQLSTFGEVNGMIIHEDNKDHLYMWGLNNNHQAGIDEDILNFLVPIKVYETSVVLPELKVMNLIIENNSIIWTYKVNDWGQTISEIEWEFTDLNIKNTKLNGQNIPLSRIQLSEPVNNIGTLTITGLEENTTYTNNFLTVYWGNTLIKSYELNDFSTSANASENEPLPDWAAGLIGSIIGIIIILIIGFIIWALIVFL